MSDAQFVINLLYSAVMACLYGSLTWILSKRRVTMEAENANRSFMMWWGSLAVLSFSGIFGSLAGRYGWWSFTGLLTYTQMLLLLITLALMGLVYYFTFLFTGSKWATSAVVVFYLGFLVFLFYFINLAHPVGLKVEDGVTRLDNERDLSGSMAGSVLGLMLLLPPVLGALAYMTLLTRTKDRTQRFRILTVGGSIFVWLGTSLTASLTGVSTADSEVWSYVSKLIAVLAVTANLIAHQPPKWIRDRLRLAGIEAS